MIERLIIWSIDNRVMVLLLAAVLALGGVYAWRATPVEPTKSRQTAST